MDEGNLKRYLLYAVGEILLVVIGILIALQINTYHQNQNNKKEARIYLHRILEDLKADLKEVKECNSSHAHRSYLTFNALKILGSQNLSQVKNSERFDNLMSNYDQTQNDDFTFGSNLAFIGRHRTFDATQIAFDELVSTGKLNFIGNDTLKENIQKHYIGVREKAGFQRYLSQYMKEYSNLISEENISNLNQESKEKILARIRNKQSLITGLENVLNVSLRTHFILSLRENSIEKSTLSLIEEIELHLQNEK